MRFQPGALTGRILPRVAAITATAIALAVPAVRASAATASTAAGTITTVAGGVGGPEAGTKVYLAGPCGVSSGDGHIYIADTAAHHSRYGHYSGAVRQMSPSSSSLSTLAGNHAFEEYANGGPASSAFLQTCGAAVDHSGNLVISDYKDERIRVVAKTTGTFYGRAMTAGHIYSVAGDGTRGFSGDGGPATGAELDDPWGVQVDSAGNLVFADLANGRIRVVAEQTGTFYGIAMTAGDIYTVAGDGTQGFSGDGGPATSAELNAPRGVALDAAGNLIIADTGNGRVRVVAASSGTSYGQAMTAGDIYTVAGDGDGRFSGNGAPAFSSGMSVDGVAVDAAGNLLIADGPNNMVHVVAAQTGTYFGQAMTAGFIYTIAGDGKAGSSGNGGPGTSAELANPEGVTVDGSGNVVIADDGSYLVRVVAAGTGKSYGQAMTADHIYTIAGTGHTNQLSGLGGPATSAELPRTAGVAADSAGNIVFPDDYQILVKAASSGTFYGRAMTAGDLYSVAGDGHEGFSGDGGPASKAEMDPTNVTVDGAGNLVIADTGNKRVRVVAEKTGTFYGIVMTAGNIYTVAGDGSEGYSGDYGPATKAALTGQQVAVDASGNLVIADALNDRIRVVAGTSGTFYGIAMTAGYIYTVAGDGTQGFSGDGGAATRAELDLPYGVTVDAADNLVISDLNNNRVRVVAENTGTYYGVPMTAGDIYNVAGDGHLGFGGDGGPAIHASLGNPLGVAVTPAGNLLISDWGSFRIRMVTG